MNSNLNKKYGLALVPQAVTNGATITANIDTLGADYATIIVPISTGVNTNAVGPTLVLKESDDTVVTNFATWAAGCTQTAVVNSTAKNFVYHIDTRTRKRYIRLSNTPGTTTNDNITTGAIYVLGRIGVSQPAASSMLASTNDAVVVL